MTDPAEAEHLVVISDVHGNARALDAAMEQTRRGPVDRLVFLGDLLTYGPDVDQVLDVVSDAVSRGAALLLGNHDQLYLDLAEGRSEYYDQLPPWLRSSVDLVWTQLDARTLTTLPFMKEWLHRSLLFAHAGPFNDWRYLSTREAQREAANELARRGLRGGVFGHTHRPRLAEFPSGRGAADGRRWTMSRRWSAPGTLVLNAGSVGQPRERGAPSTLLRLTLTNDHVLARIVPIHYDLAGHVRALSDLPLPSDTRRRLLQWT